MSERASSPEELAKSCYENRECRKKFVELARSWFQDQITETIVTALRIAAEPEGVLKYIIVGAFGGLGFGVFIGLMLAKYILGVPK
ncbi:MAG: hypothetical protein QW512_02030 [Thermofilaceae archaeon]